MPAVMATLPREGDATKVSPRRWRKHALPFGKFQYKDGRVVNITPEFAQKLKENFDAKVRGVAQVSANGPGGHSDDWRDAVGQTVGLEVDPSKGIYVTLEVDETADEAIAQRKLHGVSLAFDEDYFDPRTQTYVGPALRHTALTNIPYIKGADVEGFEEAIHLSEGETLVLLTEVVDPETPPVEDAASKLAAYIHTLALAEDVASKVPSAPPVELAQARDWHGRFASSGGGLGGGASAAIDQEIQKVQAKSFKSPADSAELTALNHAKRYAAANDRPGLEKHYKTVLSRPPGAVSSSQVEREGHVRGLEKGLTAMGSTVHTGPKAKRARKAFIRSKGELLSLSEDAPTERRLLPPVELAQARDWHGRFASSGGGLGGAGGTSSSTRSVSASALGRGMRIDHNGEKHTIEKVSRDILGDVTVTTTKGKKFRFRKSDKVAKAKNSSTRSVSASALGRGMRIDHNGEKHTIEKVSRDILGDVTVTTTKGKKFRFRKSEHVARTVGLSEDDRRFLPPVEGTVPGPVEESVVGQVTPPIVSP